MRFTPGGFLVLSFVALACGSEGDGDDGGPNGSMQVPTDSSAQAISAFVVDGGFTGSEWQSDVDAPRAGGATSPHQTVRVYLNDLAVEAQAGVMSALDVEYPVGAMAVKEMYDGSDVVGHAAMFKTEAGEAASTWTYWCYGPAGRCVSGEPETTPETALYGAPQSSCSVCHGGNIFTLIQ